MTQPTEREFRPEEFEDIDLPVEVPPEEEGEFEDIELDLSAWGAAPPDEALLSARDQLEQRLLLGVTEQALSAESGTDAYGFENIVGVGIGEKIRGDEYTDEPCVVVYVAAKASPSAIQAEALVPSEVNGVPTDVVVTGEFHAFPFKGRYRPAFGGASVGHYRITAGTLGCLVRRGRALYILSNNHVLANSNVARIGDPIVQPGPYDGGRVPRDVIARLSQFVPIQFGGPANTVDCAIAQTSPRLVTPLNRCYGRISPTPVRCSRGLLVKKCGRTTQATRGVVVDCHATVRVGYGTSGIALFRNQIMITSLSRTPFSAGGDSGSLVMTYVRNRPVGLLFAGSATHTIANHITDVLQALNVTIVA